MTHAIIMAFSRELVTRFLTVGNEISRAECVEGLPDGAVLTGAGIDQYGELVLRFEHPSFPECAEGAQADKIMAIFKAPERELRRDD